MSIKSCLGLPRILRQPADLTALKNGAILFARGSAQSVTVSVPDGGNLSRRNARDPQPMPRVPLLVQLEMRWSVRALLFYKKQFATRREGTSQIA